jgi:hypothetical protein
VKRDILAVNIVSGALLLALFLVSWNSLLSFPDSFADEGYYGEAGFSLVSTGTFTPYNLPDTPAFRRGDGIHPHLVSGLFGYLGKELGYSLRTARTISFIMVWVAILLWLLITRSLGLTPLLGALLFASSERVFWASHVFRPEATLVLLNTVFVLLLVLVPSAESRTRSWVGRGLLNGALVLAHGNGLVSACLNSLDALASCVGRARRERLVRLAAYGAGTLLAVGLFYLIQVKPIGGWGVFGDQLSAAGQYLPRGGVLRMVRSDIEDRWGKELVVVGASRGGKVMRGAWYATVLGAALWSALGPAGLARRLGVMTLGTVVGYTFLVHDRIDIHIAEMIPFFCAAFLAWVSNASRAAGLRLRVAGVAVAVVLVSGLGLCLHHGLKYRPQVYRPAPELTSSAIRGFLDARAARSEPPVRAVVGDENLWFSLRGVTAIVSPYRAGTEPVSHGDVVVAVDPAKVPWLDRCARTSTDPGGTFAVYRCP